MTLLLWGAFNHLIDVIPVQVNPSVLLSAHTHLHCMLLQIEAVTGVFKVFDILPFHTWVVCDWSGVDAPAFVREETWCTLGLVMPKGSQMASDVVASNPPPAPFSPCQALSM